MEHADNDIIVEGDEQTQSSAGEVDLTLNDDELVLNQEKPLTDLQSTSHHHQQQQQQQHQQPEQLLQSEQSRQPEQPEPFEQPVQLEQPVQQRQPQQPQQPAPLKEDEEVNRKLPDNFATLHCSFGFESQRRDNIAYVEDGKLLFSVGSVVQLLDLNTMQQQFVSCSVGHGITAIAVHPAKSHFAIAGKGTNPEIHVYSYPALHVEKVLKGGAMRAFTTMSFNPTGSRLASVGGFPDFVLTLWDWEREVILLRHKAFSQDVFKVYFSPRNEGTLITSGTGHIKFWNMAKTFTGLKLQVTLGQDAAILTTSQGEIGKFGKSELTDISGLVELPNGKVLTGTEVGNMLLWDENTIKREICRDDGQPCHQGMIEVVFVEGNVIITAGKDGFVRMWDLDALDTADAVEDSLSALHIQAVLEIRIGTNVQIKGMLKGEDHWIIHDATGALWKLDLKNGQRAEQILTFHAGEITGVDASPCKHIAASTGADGTVRVFNYVDARQLGTLQFSAGGSALAWAPLVPYNCQNFLVTGVQATENSGTIFAVGFNDGIVRVLCYVNDQLHVLRVFKPHQAKITALKYSPNGEKIATASVDGTIFFLSTSNSYTPIGFVRTPSPVTTLTWGTNSRTIIASCDSGAVVELSVPHSGGHDTSQTYELTGLTMRELPFQRKDSQNSQPKQLDPRVGQKPHYDENADEYDEQPQLGNNQAANSSQLQSSTVGYASEENEPQVPSKGVCVLYKYSGLSSNDCYLITRTNKDAGFIYEMNLQSPTPEVEHLSHKPPAVCGVLAYSQSKNYLVSGDSNGTIHVRRINGLEKYWVCNTHTEKITGLVTSFDDAFLMSIAHDGSFFVHKFAEGITAEEKLLLPIIELPKQIPDLKPEQGVCTCKKFSCCLIV